MRGVGGRQSALPAPAGRVTPPMRWERYSTLSRPRRKSGSGARVASGICPLVVFVGTVRRRMVCRAGVGSARTRRTRVGGRSIERRTTWRGGSSRRSFTVRSAARRFVAGRIVRRVRRSVVGSTSGGWISGPIAGPVLDPIVLEPLQDEECVFDLLRHHAPFFLAWTPSSPDGGHAASVSEGPYTQRSSSSESSRTAFPGPPS
jgi:hypothetical protein